MRMRKKNLFAPLFALLTLFVLTTAVLASEPVFTDAEGNAYDGEAAFYEAEAPAPLALAAAEPAPQADLIPLGDPVNLHWHKKDPASSTASSEDLNGKVFWEIPGDSQGKFLIKYYRKDNPDVLVDSVTSHFGSHKDNSLYYDCTFYHDTGAGFSAAGKDHIPSGDYYFTVQNIGDGITYSNSAVVSSLDMDNGGIYKYVEPQETLETPAKGRFEWPKVLWNDQHETDKKIPGYNVVYGFSKEPTQNPDVLGGDYNWFSGLDSFWLQEKLIGENGAGWYYFRVQANSANIEQWQNSGWSEWSEGYNLAEAAKNVTESLETIKTSASTKEQICEEVQKLGQTELRNALTADILGNGTGASEALEALEKTAAVGGPAKSSVDSAMADKFTADEVSIVGAALNTTNGTDAPVLNIGAPKSTHDIAETQYNSTIAVEFSMDLANVSNPDNLAVPVKITLPIPENINPDFLVILHYRSNGVREEVIHNVFQKDNKWYVSFVLTSFSDFTLTEEGTTGSGPSIAVQSGGKYGAVRAPEDAHLFFAKYEGDRIASVQELPHSGTLTGSGKLFLLDHATLKPLCAGAEL